MTELYCPDCGNNHFRIEVENNGKIAAICDNNGCEKTGVIRRGIFDLGG
ncbi:MAG: hypothetical protein V3U02_12230 [Calditrichia bacterium]